MDNKTLDKLNKDLKNYSKSIGKVTDSFLSTLAECFPKMEERKKKNLLDLVKLCENQLQTINNNGILFLFEHI